MRVEGGEHAVTSWIWRGDAFDPEPRLADRGSDGPHPGEFQGHFALHQEPRRGEHVLARDRMGVNKLFYVVDRAGEVHSSNFLIELRRMGFPLSSIHSVPSGHSVTIVPERRELVLEEHSRLRFEEGRPEASGSIEEHARAVRASLDATFERLAGALQGRRVFVTLSGGLDSTTIAVLAHHWLEDVTAVTFCLDDGTDRSDPGGDLSSARRVAEELGMPLQEVGVTADELVSLVDPVLVWGQDWRDFNVHCGLVNAAIALRLRERLGLPSGLSSSFSRRSGASAGPETPRPVILTGDTMNEIMADYAPEWYRGVEYYSLPRMPVTRLRRFLVDGLDSGDREVGIFARFGFDTLQPYALSADAYTAFPGSHLESDHVKQRLARAVMGREVPAHVYERPKVRAQVASAAGVSGTLASVVDRGYDSRRLALRFAELFGAGENELGSLIRAGFYRFAVEFPSDPGCRQDVEVVAE